ncbi:MAG: twin-arginine translocase subunit TatC [Candidatus Latescibacteria bacterium]|nr:twin-arginine translocase subunit TatC [Candidatus Latescibacterota bacterium]NIO01010.1 twin-arginine translocase subunit TatC [Candidatus Latescibacterota bacterium]NIO27409.1 twin-arginine translocase subunit TatC [Candidatus Latescibacterota bacterium]NIO54931.1 twin-arginine translocase subunit TatC [Candidatus Latescibacterota bacterium]NIT01020.1 twin-arginine translocase subunit TatC [Candidatus Latescibacterota bacterium]
MKPRLEESSITEDNLKEMSFLDHLEELRSTIIQSLVVFFVLSVLCWFFSGKILDILINDLPVESLYFHSPLEAFMVRLKVSFVLGFMLAFPFVLSKIWAFISPGLFTSERKKVFPFILSSSALFYAGVLFCYLILIPIVLQFLLRFGTENINPLLSVQSSFTFVARLCFTFGIVFQLPIVVLVLSLLGIVTPQFLLRQWRYAIVAIFVAAAILTPPDAVSQVLMAGPIFILYMGSVAIAMIVVRKKKEDEEE